MKTRKRSLWREIPELWVVLLPLLLAILMGATTLTLAIMNPDPAIARREAGPLR